MDIKSTLEGTLGVSEAVGLGIATRVLLGERAVHGAFYAVGAEKIVSNNGFGMVFSDSNFSQLSRLSRFGMTNIAPSNGAGFFNNPLTFQSNLPGNYSTPVGNNLVPGGIIQGSRLSVGLPLALSIFFAGKTLADEGATGLPGYLLRDSFVNYSAMNATTIGGNITDHARASAYIGTNIDQSRGSYQYAKGLTGNFMRMPIVARLTSITAGHFGAQLGASAGQSLLSGLSSTVNEAIGFNLLNETVAGMFGYIFGAAGGAAVGAHIGASLANMAIVGAGAYAMKEVVSSTYAMVEGGFARAQRNKGLNYAGDTAAFFTQNAVTMRERALQAMNKSHMNARSAFGQEANIVHMNRDMFSHYKRY